VVHKSAFNVPSGHAGEAPLSAGAGGRFVSAAGWSDDAPRRCDTWADGPFHGRAKAQIQKAVWVRVPPRVRVRVRALRVGGRVVGRRSTPLRHVGRWALPRPGQGADPESRVGACATPCSG
jgi:hypothetical protein